MKSLITKVPFFAFILFSFCINAQVSLDTLIGSTTPPNDTCRRQNNTFVLKQNEIWSVATAGANEFFINNNIMIPRGKTLIITSGIILRFAQDLTITVETGGALVVHGDNSPGNSPTLTSCTESTFWGGIDVRGNSNQGQSSMHQGMVQINQGATISNAKVAVEQSGGCNVGGGGIIQVSDAFFINNFNSILFRKYSFWSSGAYQNASIVNNTRFEITPAYEAFDQQNPLEVGEIQIGNQLILEENYGLEITACEFLNNYSNTSATASFAHSNTLGSAIYASNSEFDVRPSAIDSACVFTDSNRFQGWLYGIYYTTNQIGHSIEVIGANFLNNKTSIFLSGCEEVQIANNRFNIDDGLRNTIKYKSVNHPSTPRIAPNNAFIHIKERTDTLEIFGNEFDVDITIHYANPSYILYDNDYSYEPDEISIMGNTFDLEIDKIAGNPFTVVNAVGILLKDFSKGISGNFNLECNHFDLYSGLNDTINTAFKDHQNVYDLKMDVESHPRIAITTHPDLPNEWSVFDTCYVAGMVLNKLAYNIWGPFDYTSHIFTVDSPACRSNAVNFTITTNGQSNCPTSWDYCFEYQPPSHSRMGANERTDIKSDLAFEMFPNPVAGHLNIETNMQGMAIIYSIDGKKIISQSVQDGRTDIDISNLLAGEYLLRFIGESEVKVRKFIKQ